MTTDLPDLHAILDGSLPPETDEQAEALLRTLPEVEPSPGWEARVLRAIADERANEEASNLPSSDPYLDDEGGE